MVALAISLFLSFQSEYKRALEEFQNHNYESAYKEFLTIYKKYPQNEKIPDVLFYLGRLESDPENARDYYRKVVISYPESELWAESLLSIAEIDYAFEKYDRVITNLERLIKSSSNSSIVKKAYHWLNSSKSLSGEKAKSYIIQLGAFNDKANAERLIDQLSKLGYPGLIKEEGGYFKVRLSFFTQEEASSALEILKEKGIEGFRVKE